MESRTASPSAGAGNGVMIAVARVVMQVAMIGAVVLAFLVRPSQGNEAGGDSEMKTLEPSGRWPV